MIVAICFASGLEHAIAGTALYVVGPDDDIEILEKSAMEDMESLLSRVDKSGEGVYVQASSLGSLEALLNFLESPAVNIPVSGINIGAAVHKKDVMKASVMLEKKKEFATILAFDVKVTPEAQEHADKAGVKIFMADIIYHLFDQFKAYIDEIKKERKREAAEDAVFPCVLKIIPNCIFNKKDPIILGVDVYDGTVKMGTPLCIPSQGFIDIGHVASIENNHKPVDSAKKGQQVALKLVAEVIATYMMVFVSCGVTTISSSDDQKITKLGASLAVGMVVTAMIYTVGHISGAHMNPAVTVAFAATKHFPWKQVPVYGAAHLIGATTASFTLRLVLHPNPITLLGTTTPSGTPFLALIMEIIVTFCMMFVTSAVATDSKSVGELVGIAVGSTVCISSILAGSISGGSMNPAKTLGPALASGCYKSMWVYVVGPLIGALMGAWLYEFIRVNDKQVHTNST